jgi:hypothetical protein
LLCFAPPLAIDKATDEWNSFDIYVSFLQIYNETVIDLIPDESKRDFRRGGRDSEPRAKPTLTIREDSSRGIFVEGLVEWKVSSVDEVCPLPPLFSFSHSCPSLSLLR